MNPTYLAIVRAALTFWDEEMGSISHETYQHYLHSKDREVVISSEDIAKTRVYFNQVEPKFGLFDLQAGVLLSTQLTDNPNELKSLSLIHI